MDTTPAQRAAALRPLSDEQVARVAALLAPYVQPPGEPSPRSEFRAQERSPSTNHH